MNNIIPIAKKRAYLKFMIPQIEDVRTIDRMLNLIDPSFSATVEAKKRVSDSDPYHELMALTGCLDAKEQLTAMITDHKMKQLVIARGRSTCPSYYHAVFSGNPGTNKSSVARLYAKAFAQAGITKNDHFSEVSRVDLVGEYIGSTSIKVDKVWNEAAGGTIFVDEAYSLCGPDSAGNNDYGQEAVNQIILHLENHPQTICIFAGYPEKMERFLDMNPGLRSRIPYHAVFDDYTTQELIAISQTIAQREGFELTDAALSKLSLIYDIAKQDPDFGNGRYVRTTIEKMIRKKGALLGVLSGNQDYHDRSLYSDDMLFTLDESCIDIDEIPVPTKPTRRAIGFCG